MTPSSSHKISQRLNLGRLKGKEIIANFSGGKITSDAGIVLMAELDKKLKITSRFAGACQLCQNR
jgi:hypothetical protein